MMKIIEIYKKYSIPPQLQLHQLRVASVAKVICENLKIPVDTYEVVSADLLHDMGNIIKFDLTLFPEYLEPEGLDYWQSVKNTFIENYGPDEHVATEKIAEEISENKRIHDILKHIGASRLDAVNSSDDVAYKIANYADDRVSVNGIVPFEKLIKERKSRNPKLTDEFFMQLIDMIGINEKNIQKVCKIDLNDITDETISGIIDELRDFEIN
ncbi:MAG TPA: hypothetical protein PKU78_00740 [Candidatus Dojkabacteria bacterium]|nr:hypothetical protein [Candidatus Dojkabacteria bacterium]HRP37253.1 hypothetical protein [Candidatus Dojkabacteria bacterium]HRP51473.1 hypothetical protein [Candidatus Dojkabacteria bacterium]